jgi:multicomponent Na+:H+ antiporter subunit B
MSDDTDDTHNTDDRNRKKHEREYEAGLVIQLVSRMMCPFIIMFGAYLIIHGHLTPGGGFQGGVVIAAAFILFALVFNRKEGRVAAPSFSLKCLASTGIYLYMAAGLLSILLGYHFLANRAAGIFPCGMEGELLSGGTLFWIDIGVGLAVASIFTDLVYAFLEEKPDDAGLNNAGLNNAALNNAGLKNKKELEDKKRVLYKRRWSDVDRDDSEQD